MKKPSKLSQPKLHSFIESVVNVLIGLGINVYAQTLVFPLFGINIPLHTNLSIAAIFTVISIVRSFGLRRIFNRIHVYLYDKPNARTA